MRLCRCQVGDLSDMCRWRLRGVVAHDLLLWDIVVEDLVLVVDMMISTEDILLREGKISW